jgi:AAA ATPase domain
VLVGRSAEHQGLARLLTSLRAGRSAVTVVTGEPGIGKAALLDWLAAAVGDGRVIRTTGVPQEADFTFGGLHQVLTPLLPYSGRLPSPQRQALQAALALDAGPAPDRFLVYLAALTLMTEAAQHHPLLPPGAG